MTTLLTTQTLQPSGRKETRSEHMSCLTRDRGNWLDDRKANAYTVMKASTMTKSYTLITLSRSQKEERTTEKTWKSSTYTVINRNTRHDVREMLNESKTDGSLARTDVRASGHSTLLGPNNQDFQSEAKARKGNFDGFTHSTGLQAISRGVTKTPCLGTVKMRNLINFSKPVEGWITNIPSVLVSLWLFVQPETTRPYTSQPRGTNNLLEPCAVKVARTVLRGEGGSNAPDLPGE